MSAMPKAILRCLAKLKRGQKRGGHSGRRAFVIHDKLFFFVFVFYSACFIS